MKQAKWGAVLLSLFLVCSLFGCSSNLEKKDVIGTWKGEPNGETAYLTFKEDGTVQDNAGWEYAWRMDKETIELSSDDLSGGSLTINISGKNLELQMDDEGSKVPLTKVNNGLQEKDIIGKWEGEVFGQTGYFIFYENGTVEDDAEVVLDWNILNEGTIEVFSRNSQNFRFNLKVFDQLMIIEKDGVVQGKFTKTDE